MVVEVGPWGGDGGANPWSFLLQDGWKLTKIRVVSTQDLVYSIQCTYRDEDNLEHDSITYGGYNDCGTKDTLIINDGEKITGISGTVGSYDGITLIKSLSFKVDTKNNGPYGIPSGTPFTLPVTSGDVSGFFGKYGAYLDSFGVILSPSCN